jgi:hypothetical protein
MEPDQGMDMSNKYWQAELWGEDPSDVCQKHVAERGFVITVRLRRQGGHKGTMFTQLFHPSGVKHSEHVFDISDDSDYQAIQHGIGHGEWLARGTRPK